MGCDDQRAPAPPEIAPVQRASAPANVTEQAWIPREEPLDACAVRLRATLAGELASALDDLGYDLVAETCRSLAAVRDQHPEACDALNTSPLRRTCRTRLAILHAAPSACPPARTLPGRDPICLAWASGDVGLCRGASPFLRTRCRAVLRNEPALCRARTESDRDACEAEVTRFAPTVSPRATGSEPAEPSETEAEGADSPRGSIAGIAALLFEGRVQRRQEPDEPEEEPFAVRAEVDRGVYLDTEGCSWLVRIGARRGVLDDRAVSRVKLIVPAEAESTLTLEVDAGATVELDRDVRSPTWVAVDGRVHLPHFEARRGAILTGRVTAMFRHAGERYTMRSRFRTYVRDLAEMNPACRESPAPETAE